MNRLVIGRSVPLNIFAKAYYYDDIKRKIILSIIFSNLTWNKSIDKRKLSKPMVGY